MKKKVSSLLLALVMLLSLVPMAAVAEDWNGLGEGQCRIIYGQDNGSVFVQSDPESYVGDGGTVDFTAETTFSLRLDTTRRYEDGDEIPDGEQLEEPAVYIRLSMDGTDVWVVKNNAAEDGYGFDNNVFSFTPSTTDPFELLICWTEERYNFETIGTNSGENANTMIELSWDGDGDVIFDDAFQSARYENRVKLVLADSTESFTFRLNPREDWWVDSIRVEQDGTEYNRNGFVDLEKDERCGYDDDVFTFTLDLLGGDGKNYDIPEEDGEGKFVFINVGFTDGNSGPRYPEFETIYDALKYTIENYVFAYCEEDADGIKAAMASELFEHRIGEEHIFRDEEPQGFGTEEYAVGEVLSKTADELKSLIELSENPETDDSIVENLSYYTYRVMLYDDDDGDENDVFAEGRVYVLTNTTDLVLKTSYKGLSEYRVIETNDPTAHNEDKDQFFYAPFFDVNDGWADVEVFGNGAYARLRSTEDEDVFVSHVTSEDSAEPIKYRINTRVIVSRVPTAIQINSLDNAAAWDFVDARTYSGERPDAGEPTVATIFFGAEKITLNTVFEGKEITGVEAVGLPEGAIDFDPITGTLTFYTNYDSIEIEIIYTDESVSYMLLNRVGLDIQPCEVQENQSDYSFCVDHGTDHFVRYNTTDTTAERVVAGTFYYDCSYSVDETGSKWYINESRGALVSDDTITNNGTGFDTKAEADNALIDERLFDAYTARDASDGKWHVYNTVKAPITGVEGINPEGGYATKTDAVTALYGLIEPVELFVTVTDNNGTATTYKTVADPLTDGWIVDNRGGFTSENNLNNVPNYTSQGSNHVHDDFLLWSGSAAEYNTIRSISAIVYKAGEGGSFGGVQVGSGAGVTWTR